MREKIAKTAKRIVVKVGSSILTTQSGYLSPNKINTIVEAISDLIGVYEKEIILVSSGAIACGMHILNFKKRPTDLAFLQASASVGQGALIHAYQKMFELKGYKCGQILLTGDGLRHRDRYLNARNTINALLGLGVIPIVNENDTVATDEICFGDNDALAAQVALMVNADLLVVLSDVDGFYTIFDGHKKVLSVIDTIDNSLKEHLHKSKTERTVGGMHSKIDIGFMLMRLGLPFMIANGCKKNTLYDIACGKEIGTLFIPKNKKQPSKKRWLAFATTAKTSGSIKIDIGAHKALKNNKSLLASGIISVEGDFKFGSAVRVVNSQGALIAKGITNFSSLELQKIKGKKTSQIKSILGKVSNYKEVIHLDNLILLD